VALERGVDRLVDAHKSRQAADFHMGGLSHPEISQFQDVNKKENKTMISHNFKIFPTFIFLYRKYSIVKRH
jgi:hypothetical protein